MDNNILLAFGLTLIAGLSTGIGSLLAFFTKRTNTKMISAVLGFSAGVMIFVSLVDILPHASKTLQASMGDKAGSWVAMISFFAGILLIAVIDKVIPSSTAGILIIIVVCEIMPCLKELLIALLIDVEQP